MAIQLAAVAPERVLAAVLINAAAGSTFDETLAALTHSPRKAARAILGMRHDTHLGAVRLPVADVSRYLQMLASAAMRNARRPIGPARAALAIAQSGDYTPLLQAMRDHRIPTMVLHGDSDVLVPFDNARDIAEHTGGSLYRLPGACHSWLIGNPRHGADALRQLLTGELGDIVNGRRRDGTAGHEAATELQAWIHRLAAERPEVVGVEQSERVEMELVDSSVELGVAI
jgi:pimeloyl-ACP methyl ester carboxylesterase